VLDYIPTDTFILVIVYEHNGNALLEYKDHFTVLFVFYITLPDDGTSWPETRGRTFVK
jgi:hypothetical protein